MFLFFSKYITELTFKSEFKRSLQFGTNFDKQCLFIYLFFWHSFSDRYERRLEISIEKHVELPVAVSDCAASRSAIIFEPIQLSDRLNKSAAFHNEMILCSPLCVLSLARFSDMF